LNRNGEGAMNIALIAHDKKKDDMIRFTTAYKEILKDHSLFATGTTGLKIMEATGLEVYRFQSGPLGGDQEIGAMIAQNKMDMVIFFRDPLTAQPHFSSGAGNNNFCFFHFLLPFIHRFLSNDLYLLY